MYTLTVNGVAIGDEYESEQSVIAAYIRLYPCVLGLGWRYE